MPTLAAPTQNAVHCIFPYRHPQAPEVWVFDDSRHGLDQEPFVGPANLTLDRIDGLLKADGRLTIFFSSAPLPEANVTLHAASKTEHAKTHGCTYHDGQREVWLCPALMHYFPGETAPETIYIKAQAGGSNPRGGI